MPGDQGISSALFQQLTLASLNRQHWYAHGSDLTSFLNPHPVQI